MTRHRVQAWGLLTAVALMAVVGCSAQAATPSLLPPPTTNATATSTSTASPALVTSPSLSPSPSINPSLLPGKSVPTGSLQGDHQGSAVVSLADGRVLIVGGQTGQPELYDPAVGTFRSLGPLPADYEAGYEDVQAVLLPSGKVLVVGCGQRRPAAALFDPKTTKFAPTGMPRTPRQGEATALLPDGRVLLVGGLTDSSGGMGMCWPYDKALASAEIYNPATGRFAAITAKMKTPRAFAKAITLKDGRVLIAGGVDCQPGDSDLQYAWLRSAEVYDPKTGTFSDAGSMDYNVDNYTEKPILLDDGRVLLAGRLGGGGRIVGDLNVGMEVYDPATGKFATLGLVPADGWSGLSWARLNDGRIILVGGRLNYQLPTGQIKIFDAGSGAFTLVASPRLGRVHPIVAVLKDGRVLIAGGSSFLTAEIWEI